MTRNCFGTAALVAALAAFAGCGNYTVTFETAPVINTYNDSESSREVLSVDILTLTKDEVERHPEIVNKRLRADEWFLARRDNDPKIADIDPNHIYALRPGAEGDMRDVLLGGPLVSAMDREGDNTVTVKIKHPQAGEKDAAIVIYGRFQTFEGIAPVPPIVIQPPPSFKDQIFISVGRDDMAIRAIE